MAFGRGGSSQKSCTYRKRVSRVADTFKERTRRPVVTASGLYGQATSCDEHEQTQVLLHAATV